MPLLKCVECGHVFSSVLNECPECGCPSEMSFQKDSSKRMPFMTDTGYAQENVLKMYSQICFWYFIIIAIIVVIATIYAAYYCNKIGLDEWQPITIFVAGITDALTLVGAAYITRAAIMIQVNMSINLHELNMKNRLIR